MTLEEARAAYRAGSRRQDASRARNGRHRWNWHPDPKTERLHDGMSAVAEALVAELLGRRWLSSGLVPDDRNAGDIEGGYSVRWTPRPRGSLIVHEDEPLALIPVLVTGPTWPLEVVGWCPMEEAQDPRYWRTRGVRHPAFFVPYAVVARRPIRGPIVDKNRGGA